MEVTCAAMLSASVKSPVRRRTTRRLGTAAWREVWRKPYA